MFVQSEKFIEAHSDHYKKKNGNGLKLNPKDRISIFGQESNQTTWRLCKMNLAIRGIDSSNVKWNNEGSFLNDAHKDLRADFILANPPFNDSDWSGELLQTDGRWKILGENLVPPAGNANYAWIQHFIYHLAPTGQAGFVLSKGSLTTQTNNEGEIRKALIEKGLVDCIVNLPTKLFLNTQIPACLWFLSRNKTNGGFRDRKNEILFIDARNLGHLVNRRNRDLSEDDIQKIAGTYHEWRSKEGKYADIPGFCKSEKLDRVKELNYVLTPGRYVGLPDDEDDFNFVERFTGLKAELEKQLAEENELNKKILENLSKINVDTKL
jgi:type I restriction enzyme M protein